MTAPLSTQDKEYLLYLARKSIATGLKEQRPAKVEKQDLQGRCGQLGASFVTLTKRGDLRGCIGSLAARHPLAEDVLDNAYAAAFRDRRFAPLTAEEQDQIEIKISILSDTEPIEFVSEADLLQQIRPGIDGLVLSEGSHRGTFLPAVWEQLTDPVDFLNHLKRKAGLPMDYWSPSMQVERYTTEEFG